MYFNESFLKLDTLGLLRENKVTTKSIKQELRVNLIDAFKKGERVFKGIHGFEHTVIPDIERSILSNHNILLLGLRGQAKTRIARLMVHLLDEYIPVIKDSELNEDPFHPITQHSKSLILKYGDDLPISWLHKSERFVEKLATPDVSVADLIGDIDPIKAATLQLNYADDRVIHFGIIPRSNRCIFIINELPDLQARIQVSLFNILQESDIQIRGFKLRLPLDIQFVFTANPEDYTNRGSIVTPLKDRIDSQILTHYPESIQIAKKITIQEANIQPEQLESISIHPIYQDMIERIVFAARESEFVDDKSGVSSRLSISAYENLISAAERRMLKNKQTSTSVRLADFWGVIPSITGKIELVYEGELEGPYDIAINLLGTAIREEFLAHFPNPDNNKLKGKKNEIYDPIIQWFNASNTLKIPLDSPDDYFQNQLNLISYLKELAFEYTNAKSNDLYVYMELILHGLAEFNIINKEMLDEEIQFKDYLADMLDHLDNDENDEFDLEEDDDDEDDDF
jgi:magnesium chelatase subunit I